MKRIGFIGMGNMGYAILKGLLQVFDREVLLLTDADRKRAEKISEETGVACAADNAACASMADYVVLAVKPQYYDAVLSDIKDTVTKEKIIISIAPSVTIQDLKEKLGQDRRIVRAMPNTPALVGMGVTAEALLPMSICLLRLWQTALSSTDFPGILRTAWPPARLWEAQKWFSRQVNIQEN